MAVHGDGAPGALPAALHQASGGWRLVLCGGPGGRPTNSPSARRIVPGMVSAVVMTGIGDAAASASALARGVRSVLTPPPEPPPVPETGPPAGRTSCVRSPCHRWPHPFPDQLRPPRSGIWAGAPTLELNRLMDMSSREIRMPLSEVVSVLQDLNEFVVSLDRAAIPPGIRNRRRVHRRQIHRRLACRSAIGPRPTRHQR